MQTIVVLFNLRDGITAELYEAWALTRDLPIVNALPSVSQFEVLKATGLLGGGEPPYQYVELLRFAQLDALYTDIGSSVMQRVATEFQAFADNPLFITTSAL